MKFMSILLSEGRKEDLKKKYTDKFKEYPDTLTFVLGIADLADSNHKYTDFVLKNLHPNSSTDEVEDAVELIKDFEQYSNRLNIKDINQYRNFEHLENVLEFVIQDSREKDEEREQSKKVDQVYEDDLFLVIKPKTEQASCKYGARTKWCVTSKGSGHFSRYTSGNQELYFIINKKNSTNQNYSKVAVHVDGKGKYSYWDSQDNQMGEREIQVLEYAFPDLIKSIKDDYIANRESDSEKFAKEVFDQYSSGESKEIQNYLGSDKTLEVFVEGFENADDLDFGNAVARVAIQLHTPDVGELIDSYIIFIRYNITNSNYLKAYFNFDGIDPSDASNFIDLNLDNTVLEATFDMSDTPATTAKSIRNYLANRIMVNIQTNKDLIKKVKGGGEFWKPNRASYGYTFKENKGLVKKLIDYLDSGYDNGTKADFLDYVGKIERRKNNGKTEYTIKGKNFWRPINDLRGYFSSFFASAKLAGIIQYQKEGTKYIIKPGPNFDAFKSGELKAL